MLFRSASNGDWYLLCPNDIQKAGIKPLQECYGQEYEDNYDKAVQMGLGKKVKAQEIWTKIIEAQIETGVPYLCSKDNANKKTNHQNIGVIKQSNLCNEIYQYTDEETTAICTLSSMILKNFVNEGKFDSCLLIDDTGHFENTGNVPMVTTSYANFIRDTYKIQFEIDTDFELMVPWCCDSYHTDKILVGDRWSPKFTDDIDMRRNFNVIESSGIQIGRAHI